MIAEAVLYHGNDGIVKTEKISFKMAHQDDLDKFVEYWSGLLQMDPDKFKRECITERWELFD